MPFTIRLATQLFTLAAATALVGCGAEESSTPPPEDPPMDRPESGPEDGPAEVGAVPPAVRAAAGESPAPADALPTVISVERDHALLSLGVLPEGQAAGVFALAGHVPGQGAIGAPWRLPTQPLDPHRFAVGDVDDDPARELVGFARRSMTPVVDMVVLGHDGLVETGHQFVVPEAVAAGDLDADGRDEIAVLRAGGLSVFDDAEAGFALLHQAPVRFEVNGADGETETVSLDQGTSIAIGDVDGDRGLDIAIGGVLDDAPVVVLLPCALGDDGLHVGAALPAVLTVEGLPAPVGDGAVSVAVDDLDGDGSAEVVLAAAASVPGLPNTYDLSVGAWRMASGQVTPAGSATFREDAPGRGRTHQSRFAAAALTTARLSAGDEARPATVVVNETLLTFGEGTWSRESWDWDPLFDCPGVGDASADMTAALHIGLTAGDFDDDGVDELAIGGVGMCAVGVYEATAGGVELDDTVALAETVPEGRWVGLAAVSFDPDVFEQALVSSRRVFTEAVPIAAIAAPPCYGDPALQDAGGCQARIGTSQSSSNGAGAGTSLSIKVSAGVTVDGGIVPVKYSMKFHLTQTVAYSHTVTETITTGSTRYFEPGVDGVLTMAIPWDEYTYEVVDSNVPEAIGTTTVLRLPRQPVHVPMSVADYNAAAAPDLQLDPAWFAHVVGDPLSYEGGETPPPGFVAGVTEEVTTVATASPFIDFATEESETIETSTSLGLSFDAEVVGLTVGAEVSATGTASMTYTIGESTTLGASISPVLDPADGYRVTLYGGTQDLERGLSLVYGNYLVN